MLRGMSKHRRSSNEKVSTDANCKRCCSASQCRDHPRVSAGGKGHGMQAGFTDSCPCKTRPFWSSLVWSSHETSFAALETMRCVVVQARILPSITSSLEGPAWDCDTSGHISSAPCLAHCKAIQALDNIPLEVENTRRVLPKGFRGRFWQARPKRSTPG
jgi:hypothetical protein